MDMNTTTTTTDTTEHVLVTVGNSNVIHAATPESVEYAERGTARNITPRAHWVDFACGLNVTTARTRLFRAELTTANPTVTCQRCAQRIS